MSTHAQRDPGGRPNTVGVDDRGLSQVLTRLEESRPATHPNVQRVHARWPFPRISVSVTVHHPGGSSITLRLACRNLSRGGIGLLHNTYIYPGSRVTVTLPRAAGGEVAVRGTVSRCEHRQGVIHEVGVRFDHEVNVREFIRPDFFGQWVSFETIAPSDLVGTIVHADASALDQKIVRHFLRETGVRLRQTATGAEAYESARAGCDLVVCERTLPDMTGPEFVGKLRAGGVRTPVVMVGATPGTDERDEVVRCGCNAFLPKPFDERQLLLAAAEFLIEPPAHEPLTQAGKKPGELASVYARRLSELADELVRLVGDDRVIDAYVVCLQMRGIAPALGFASLGERADQLAAKLSAGGDSSLLLDEASDLAGACSASRRVG